MGGDGPRRFHDDGHHAASTRDGVAVLGGGGLDPSRACGVVEPIIAGAASGWDAQHLGAYAFLGVAKCVGGAHGGGAALGAAGELADQGGEDADLRDRRRFERKVGAPKRLRPDEIRAESRCTEMTPTERDIDSLTR